MFSIQNCEKTLIFQRLTSIYPIKCTLICSSVKCVTPVFSETVTLKFNGVTSFATCRKFRQVRLEGMPEISWRRQNTGFESRFSYKGFLYSCRSLRNFAAIKNLMTVEIADVF